MSVAAPRRPTVRIYRTDVAAFDDRGWSDLVAAEDLAALPPSQSRRRRAEHLAGRALLRAALQDWTGEPALSHPLRTSATGKPECVAGPELSVAHSRGVVVCALAPAGRIGIDVEIAAPGRAIEGIAARHFSADETRWVDSQPERFYRLWVLKEAYLKALGLGLAGGLDALCCAIEPPRIEARVRGSGDPPELALYSVADALVGVATLGSGLADLTAFRWTPAEPPRPAPLDLIARTAA